MRIKVCISNFGESQLKFMEKVVDEFKSFKKHKVDITVYTTVRVEEEHILFPESIAKSLPFMCREDMAKNLENYDLFIFTENDQLITEENVDTFIEISKKLDENRVCGFIRYEQIYGLKILLEHNPYYGDIINYSNPKIFATHNNHQGCWVLLKNDLRKVISSGNFLVDPHEGPYGILEQGASDPYTQCGIERVLPMDLNILKKLMIQHLPVKYSIKDEWINHGIFIENLYKEAHLKNL